MDYRKQPGLTPAVFQILLALSDADRHGYAIIKEVERRSDGEVVLRPGTLYRALTRLADSGWIETAPDPVVTGSDERRKYYRLTDKGRMAAREEALRLAAMVRSARLKDVLSEADLV